MDGWMDGGIEKVTPPPPPLPPPPSRWSSPANIHVARIRTDRRSQAFGKMENEDSLGEAEM